MNSITINIDGEDVGLNFGLSCLRWFNEAKEEEPDMFDKENRITDIGLSKLIECAYRLERRLEKGKEKPVIPFRKFYEWVEKRLYDNGEGKQDIIKVMTAFNESPVIKQIIESDQSVSQNS